MLEDMDKILSVSVNSLSEMGKALGDISKAMFGDIYSSTNKNLVKAINTVDIFTFNNALDFFKEKVSSVSNASKCLISVNNRYETPVPIAEKSPNVNYIVRMIILDNDENPILADENSYVGRVVYTNAIDNKLQEFLNGEIKKIITESDIPKVICTYKMIKEYYLNNIKKIPNAKNLEVWIRHEDEIPNFSQKTGKNKLVVRVLFLDSNGQFIHKNENSYYGLTLLVDDIDLELKNLMNEEYRIVI